MFCKRCCFHPQLLVTPAHPRPTRCGASLLPPRFRRSPTRCWATGTVPPRLPLCLLLLSFPFSFSFKVNLSDCYNVIVFLAPSVKPPLATKLLAELPDEARVVAGRFPFPSWTPTSTLGQGLEQVWAYDMKEVRRAAQSSAEGSPV
ncbi:hypothetical protein llap_21389 [Limosa lapponica baueri]|uniref:Protein FAM173A n=1 Tax=Limosa lapponica baueri TaxID=1758121 RepID=A0A2I0T3E8_LIMLA|nr:hypothetical protein llap_21389 [Limosa lapponica baueri]